MKKIKATIMETENTTDQSDSFITRAEVEEIITEKIGSIRVYISEADITRAQENARTMSDNAQF